MKSNDVMVSVIVLTYNQEKWIQQTLDSILAQETTYSYEVIIGEDCSTDSTHAICDKYVSKYNNFSFAPQEHNLGLIGNWANCCKRVNGKYLMLCAGDDYWINSSKIQLQVDYMEVHPECVICHTDYDKVNELTGKVESAYNKSHAIMPPQGMIHDIIRSGNAHISAITQCIRFDIAKKMIPFDKFVELGFPREDWPTQLILSKCGEVHYIPITTAAYRVGQESVTNMLNYDRIRIKYEKDYNMVEYLYSIFPEWGQIDQGTIDYFKNYLYHSLLVASYRNNDYKSAKLFRFKDPTRSIKKYMSYTWVTFKIMRYAMSK